MFRDVKINTPSLAGGTELLVMAPIKPGLVPTLDAITYKSRAKALLRLLHSARQSQHEFRLLRSLSDAAERVGVIHTLRLAVIEGACEADDKILLSVNFDGAYEAYVRVIWQKSSRLLDLIFCNTVDYVTGWDHSYDEWSRWLHSVQVPTPFFYAPPGLTMPDRKYLRMLERRDRGGATDEQDRTRIVIPSAEEIAWRVGVDGIDPTDRPQALEPLPTSDLPTRELIRQSLQTLAGIYRLADLYREGTDDGLVLLRAAQETLPEFQDLLNEKEPHHIGGLFFLAGLPQLQRQLTWFLRATLLPVPAVRVPPPLGPSEPDFERSKVQGGVVHEYPDITDGCLCLLSFADMAAAAVFLAAVIPNTDTDAVVLDQPLVNVAFTAQGLRACGLPEAQLMWLPIEFRQGMAARAGLLGDVRGNHPRRWELPCLNWPAALAGPLAESPAGAPRVAMENVHAVLQLRVKASQSVQGAASEATAILSQALQDLLTPLKGVTPLSLTWMARNAEGIDHFDFIDGQSQPRLDPEPGATKFPNQVQLGEVLVGYDNAIDHAKDLSINQNTASQALLRAGSFLVVRKLRQNLRALNGAVKSVVDAEAGAARPIDSPTVLAHMMGRWPNSSATGLRGKPLATLGGGSKNDFDYLYDQDGRRCPLGAHIRRANPRDQAAEFPSTIPGSRPPRFMRRSLPYGTKPNQNNLDADRGLVFMAYNARVGEQFEVVQRWLAGGNSSNGFSGTACPFLGVPESGRQRNLRFEYAGRTIHMPVDGSDDLGEEPEALITLQWGLYAFAPSEDGRQFLLACANSAQRDLPWSAADGLRQIERLVRLEAESGQAAAALAWKTALEDSEAVAQYDSASIWAAIREYHGGVFRVPYGLLVASRSLVDEVLADAAGRYTVKGYQKRLSQSIGPIFLGMDRNDPQYARQSTICNQAIQKLKFSDGFAEGRKAAQKSLEGFKAQSIANAKAESEPRWELIVDGRDVIESTLADLCEIWFGLVAVKPGQTKGGFARGGFDWSWKPGDSVFYPGHFTSVSRATFQPLPTDEVAAMSVEQGNALAKEMLEFLYAQHASVTAPIARAVLDDLWVSDPAVASQTIVGAMLGILPTTDGTLRRVLGEWTRDGTLHALRMQMPAGGLSDVAVATKLLNLPLRQTMMLRPVPEKVWRTALSPHWLGSDCASRVYVKTGDKIILGLVSATQEGLAQAAVPGDVFPVFGGDRSAASHPPTHACPGYHAAMGVMVGMLSALLDVDADLEPSPAPGILMYSGVVPGGPTKFSKVTGQSLGAAKAGARPELLGYGDSWIYNFWAPAFGYSHFGLELTRRGFDTSTFKRYAFPKRRLAEMWAQDQVADPRTIYGYLRQRLSDFADDPQANPLPQAIVLGGGGNDVKDPVKRDDDSPLDAILEKAGTDPALNEKALTAFLDNMSRKLADIIRQLSVAAQDSAKQQQIPIIVHAYDHPFPDGCPSIPRDTPPLRPKFTRKGYPAIGDDGAHVQADPAARVCMATLIDRLNESYSAVVVGLAAKGIDVHFLHLAGTLEAQANLDKAVYQKYWANELHPTQPGFEILAGLLVAKIAQLQARRAIKA